MKRQKLMIAVVLFLLIIFASEWSFNPKPANCETESTCCSKCSWGITVCEEEEIVRDCYKEYCECIKKCSKPCPNEICD